MAGRSPENNVFDFRAGVSRQKQGKLRGLALLVAGGLLVGILAGVLGIYWPFWLGKRRSADDPQLCRLRHGQAHLRCRW